jgi:hypothetical protein
MLRRGLAVLALALLLPGTASAHSAVIIARAVSALNSDPVWVDPAAIPSLTATEAGELRRGIREAGGGIDVAIMPADALHEQRTAEGVLREIARRVGRSGTYVVVVGGQLRAASSGGAERTRVPKLADSAFAEHRSEGLAPTLTAFVDSVAAARGRDDGAGGGGRDGIGIGVVAAGIAVAVGLLAVARRRQRAQALARVKEVAEEDLLALGEDIRELDLDVELPGVDPHAREDYGRAVAAYERASTGFSRARAPADLEPVSAALEEGRYAMVSAKARLAGEEPPERRPPCFFDPRHGPSVRDVEWAPRGGEPRPVPVCAADAIRIEEGEEPATRHVVVNGTPVPYWSAGPAFSPWAGGFFGGATGALVPLLFMDSVVGDAYASGDTAGDNFDDVGGGDFGGSDFGGGDFCGGDVGGGDFGGGGGD